MKRTTPRVPSTHTTFCVFRDTAAVPTASPRPTQNPRLFPAPSRLPPPLCSLSRLLRPLRSLHVDPPPAEHLAGAEDAGSTSPEARTRCADPQSLRSKVSILERSSWTQRIAQRRSEWRPHPGTVRTCGGRSQTRGSRNAGFAKKKKQGEQPLLRRHDMTVPTGHHRGARQAERRAHPAPCCSRPPATGRGTCV